MIRTEAWAVFVAAAILVAGPGSRAIGQTFSVCFCAPETDTGYCSPFTSAYTATLQPLGLSRYVHYGQGDGSGCIDGVPPGTYVLEVSRSCNPFGCLRRELAVEVVDAGVWQFIPRLPCRCGYYPYYCSEIHPRTLALCVAAALGDEAMCPICDTDDSGDVTIEDLVENVIRLDEECPLDCR